MALVHRNGNSYYYRTRRVGDRVVSEYAGRGTYAYLAEWEERTQRDERKAQRLELARFIEEQRRVDQAMDTYHNQVKQLVAATLQQLGYHRHKRQWRLKRQAKDREMATKAMIEEYCELHKAALDEQASQTAIERLRQYADANPTVFDGVSIVASRALRILLDQAIDHDATRIHFKGEVLALERSLGYATALPLEQLLIKSVALCWLRLQLMEQTYSQACTGPMTFAQSDALEKRLSATQIRYLRAVESLARTRALLVRAGVQINVAQNQVVVNS